MPPKFSEWFRKENLDEDHQFDRAVSKAAAKEFDELGVNLPAIHQAYQAMEELNKKRKEPHHKNYLLNLLQTAALGSSRLEMERMMNPNVEEDIKAQIQKFRTEDED